jgi:hypothetical protein
VCHEGPVDPCVDILEGEEAAEIPVVPPPPASGPNGSEAGPTDVPAVIQTLFQDLTPPEDATIFTASARAGVNEIQAGVRGFALESGPADAPSFHDFHHLQIAFEHVWQELFDDGLVHHGTELYAQLVELGFDPNEYLSDSNGTGLPGLIKAVALHAATATPPVPFSVLEVFDITPENWASLAAYQGELQKIAETVLDVERGKVTSEATTGLTEDAYRPGNEHWREYYYERIARLRREGDRIIDHARRNLTSAQRYDQFHQILADLQKSLREPYRFSIYAADGSGRSVNFGMVATYRHKWEPVSYQVGELVKTVALAPKEVRRYSKKQAIRKSRAEKEVENSLQSRKTDSTETTRSEKEIVQKALNKTNFQLTAEGGVDVGIANAKGTTALTLDAAAESQEVKFEFREAVRKAAEEYKLERALEINVGSGEDLSAEESGEISNPNDEISVTYLFYQLQRRYRVSEEIHRVTPVILVAQEFPKPSEIDEDWILAHDWILRRVLLDDSFVPAMNYLATKVVGDEVSLQEMYLNLQQERRIAEELKDELVRTRAQLSGRYAALESSIKKRAEALEGDDSGVPVPMPVGFLFAGSDASPEAAQVREDAARDAYERAARKEKEVLDRLERETTSLSTLTETYTKTLSEHLNQKAQIARLRVHIKANIMYYMQAIWTHEPPDQRFFRLHEVQVPKLSGKTTYKIESDPDALPMPPDWKKPHRIVAKCELDANLEYETLEEVADLDNLLGFKGNYMMFPLRKTNVLTEFMMVPYFDAVMGLRDPDPLGGWTVADFVKYVCCLDHTLSAAEFAKLLPGLMEAYRRLVNAPGTGGEEIIVPTDSLFIEALPGAHPILEDFKLFHRAVDVKKVQAEVRAAELENLRAAARLLAGEREDPNIEKKVIIEGGTGVIVAPDDN